MEQIRETLEKLVSNTQVLTTTAGGDNEDRESEESKREKLRKALGLTSVTHTFENFKRDKGTQRAFEAMKAMVEGGHQPLLLIYGNIGNGKTYLCEALCIELYKRGIRCPVNLWAELRRVLLRKMHRPRPGEMGYDDYFEQLRKSRYIIIDDVGMGSKGTEWEMCELEDIINYRYRERLFTVMTTNRTLDELPERVVSRFFDPEVGEVVLNEGRDYRLPVK